MKRALAFVCILLLEAAPALAAAVRHTVKRGETLEGLAKTYYGDDKKALYIARFNSFGPKKSLVPGKTVLIPFVTLHTVKRKGGFKDLARKYLKDARKSRALAELNGMDDKEVLRPGRVVKIPVEVWYRVEPGDTMAGIADKFFGDQKDAMFLKEYNRLRDVRDIAPGKKLVIPLMPERVKAAAAEVPRPKTVPSSIYAKDLRAAVAAYDDGEYRGSLEKLRGIILAVGEDNIRTKDRVRIHHYLACDYVAIDETEAAKGEFLKILSLDPSYRPDPRETSPKILEVFDAVSPKKHKP